MNYLLDSNVLIRNFDEILATKSDCGIIIPLIVLEEVDNLKKRDDLVGFLCRQVNKRLFEITKYGDISEWIRLENNVSIKVVSESDFELKLSYKCNDDIILGCLSYSDRTFGKTILLTNDINMAIKAKSLKFESQTTDEDKESDNYDGHISVEVEDSLIDEFYRNGKISWESVIEEKPYLNMCVTMISNSNDKKQALSIFRNGRLEKLRYGNTTVFGNIKAQNRQQKYLLEMLVDDDIKILAVSSPAGSGKSFMTTAVGLQKVLEEQKYKKIIYVKPLEAMGGKEIGFLPSSKNDKLLDGYSGTITNILENIFVEKEDSAKGKISYTEYLIEKGQLQVEAPTFMRGMSYVNSFIIIDESSNISQSDIKNIATRCGKNSKIVFIGDSLQIDTIRLNKYNNGLTYLISKLKDSEIFATIKLDKSVRSEVSQLCIDRL